MCLPLGCNNLNILEAHEHNLDEFVEVFVLLLYRVTSVYGEDSV